MRDAIASLERIPVGQAVIEQLLREWPPGFGGVERVAHELATVWGGTVYSFDVQSRSTEEQDALPVQYSRVPLACLPPMGRLRLPWPSRRLWQLLHSSRPLHGHLPSPGVLLVLVLARLMRPSRSVTAHWHCFLEPGEGFSGRLFAVYQRLALAVLPHLSGVITTSPLLREALMRCGCAPGRVHVLPCCLSQQQERDALALSRQAAVSSVPMRVLFIGRLDSYKRLDWLMQALVSLSLPWCLDVVGDGPRRPDFERLRDQLLAPSSRDRVRFLGRLPEAGKLTCLEHADLLVLPSDRSNEAFGIVQLEAMAAGIPALAFALARSGMGWVGQLPGLSWSQQPADLPLVLERLASDPSLRFALGIQARNRYQELFARRVWLTTLRGVFQR